MTLATAFATTWAFCCLTAALALFALGMFWLGAALHPAVGFTSAMFSLMGVGSALMAWESTAQFYTKLTGRPAPWRLSRNCPTFSRNG